MKLFGEFIDLAPTIRAGISSDGRLLIGRGRYGLVIDTGFNGDMSAPRGILHSLDLVYSGTMPFQLADGSVKWKHLWQGWIVLGEHEYETIFIEGDFLLGMELSRDLFKHFILDFDLKHVELRVR